MNKGFRTVICWQANRPKNVCFSFVLLVFVFFQYLVRAWLWIVGAIGALVLIPIGQEDLVFIGRAAAIANDRKLVYSFLFKQFLPPWMAGFF